MLDDKTALRVYHEQCARLVAYAARLMGDADRAEDVVPDAWIVVSEQAARGTVRDFGAYLRMTVRNMAIDSLRRHNRHDRIAGGNFDTATETVPTPEPAADARLIAEQEAQRLRDALARLPERQRIAVEMHRLGDYKLRDIAERFGVSVAYAQELVARGLAQCARHLKEGN